MAKKICPDLVAMSDSELRQFWFDHHPDQLKRLGDRLLAESLPRFEPRPEEFYPGDLSQLRLKTRYTQTQLAELLGVTPTVLAAWEEREVRPPASLALIYEKLSS